MTERETNSRMSSTYGRLLTEYASAIELSLLGCNVSNVFHNDAQSFNI